MAFEIKKFTSVNAQGYGEGLMNEWKYVTTDPETALGVGDYFKDVQKSLAVGDLIRVYFFSPDSGNGSYYQRSKVFCVRMSDGEGDHVAALGTSALDGQGVLKNISGGDAGTIPMSADYTVTAAYAILSGGVDSVGDANGITVKNGSTLLFSGSITSGTANGTVLALTKNGSASAASFKAASFAIANDGGAASAHGTVTVVLVSTL
jgi:hypothetical protein